MLFGRRKPGYTTTVDAASDPEQVILDLQKAEMAAKKKPKAEVFDIDAASETARRLKGQAPIDFPQETAIGALGLYVSNQTVGVFQPMNINFGIIPPLDHRVKGKRNKNADLSRRSLDILSQTIEQEVLYT